MTRRHLLIGTASVVAAITWHCASALAQTTYRRIMRLHLPCPSRVGEGFGPRNGTIKTNGMSHLAKT
jgi:hypothetical protein